MTIAGSIRTKVSRAKPGTLFTVDEFEGSRGAVETALSRLEDRGDLKRVRKGLYFKGVRSRFGSGHPRPEDIVYKLCGTKGVGPAGWSAARALGLTTQLPTHAEFALVKAPPTDVPGAKFHTRKNLERLTLNPREIAVLETLRGWPTHSEATWDGLVRRVDELIGQGVVRPDRLTRAASKEHSSRLRESLAALLSDLR